MKNNSKKMNKKLRTITKYIFYLLIVASLFSIAMFWVQGIKIPFGSIAIILGGYWFAFLSPFDLGGDGDIVDSGSDCGDGGCD
jgi:hypothetical protein